MQKIQEEIFPVYKPVGKTPYELIQRFREKKKVPESVKVAYAGRLDPMAEGVMLFVVGKKLANFNSYLKLKKEYEADILFGFNTDTYDVLGFPQKKIIKEINVEEIKKKIIEQNRIFSFSLPPFSSYKIQGNPLFYWAREGKINEIRIPTKKIIIHDLRILSHYKISEREIEKNIINKVSKVKGSFRQEETIKKWINILNVKEQKHLVVKIKIAADSGFYVRSFADKIGEESSLGAVLFHLKRLKIDKYSIKDCIKL